MQKNVTRVIETPTGVGRLSQSGHDLGVCRYWLQVEKEIRVIHTYRQMDNPPARISVDGVLVTQQNLAVGDLLTLRLQGGRHLDIRVERVNSEIGNYRIRASEGFR